jgi:hypothetical protein
MGIGIVMMVRNECDIIELSVRHACNIATTVKIIDHLSDDGSEIILQRLSAELDNLTIERVTEAHFDQSKHITKAVNKLARDAPNIDYIIPLDADEFLPFISPDMALSFLESNLTIDNVGTMPWITFCPIKQTEQLSKQSLIDGFRARTFEPDIYPKVIIGRNLALKAKVGAGNHNVAIKGHTIKLVSLGISLQHLPIRNEKQIVRKALLGEFSLALKPKRKKSEGFHWNEMSLKIRQNHYHIPEAELLSMARLYAVKQVDQAMPEIDYEKTLIISDNIETVYKDLQNICLITTMDNFISNLVEKQKAANKSIWFRLVTNMT